MGPQGGRFRTNCGIRFVEIPGVPVEIDRDTAIEMGNSLASIYDSSPEMKEITISEKNGYEFNFLTNIGGETVRVLQSVFIEDKGEYVISFGFPVSYDFSNKCLSHYQKLIESFKLAAVPEVESQVP